MHSKFNKIFTALLLLVAVACVKKRPEFDGQGQNLELLRTMSFDSDQTTFSKLKSTAGRSCSQKSVFKTTDFTIDAISTMEYLENTIAQKVDIEEGVKGYKFLNTVNFKSNDPLLKDRSLSAKMLGTPGEKYPVVYQFTPNYLIINKVVNESQLSHYEKAYSCQLDSRWLVPVGGYSVVDYYNVVNQVNSENRETNIKVKVKVDPALFKTADAYLINDQEFTPFERVHKTDLMPKSFFTDSEWYFSKTNVATRYGAANRTGGLGATDSNFQPSSKIKFFIQDDALYALNTNVDEELKEEDNNLNFDVSLIIPVENLFVRRAVENQGFVTLDAEAAENTDLEKSPYIALTLKEVENPSPRISRAVPLTEMIRRVFEKTTNKYKDVVNLRIGKDYFSFMLENGEGGTLTRYAFKKVEQDKVDNFPVRRLYNADFEKFGAFDIRKAQKFDFKINKKDDIDKNVFMARHDPRKDIVYHFSNLTPLDDYYRDIGREVINLWQQAFAKAGLDITIRLEEAPDGSSDVDLGDIRYNVLNLPAANQVGLLGFGPSLIDADNGQIVSSSSNTYLGTIILSQYRVVREYLGRTSGVFYNFKKKTDTTIPKVIGLFESINQNQIYMDTSFDPETNEVRAPWMPIYGSELLNEDGVLDVDSNSATILSYLGLSSQQTFENFVTQLNDFRYTQVEVGSDGRVKHLQQNYGHGFLNSPSMDSHHFEQFNSTPVTDAFIEEKCPEVKALADRMAVEFVSTPEEIQIIEPCVRMLAQADAIETTIHEVGHNLSLRHNFIGSYDEANWPKESEYTLKYFNNSVFRSLLVPVSSSVMEYTAGQEKNILPGGYDVAALRWIYGQKVELTDGSIIRVPASQTINETLQAGQEPKPYGFCTDEHAYFTRPSPFCVTRDRGTTQIDIVKN